MTQWWQYWPSKLSSDFCDQIVKTAKEFPAVDGLIGHGGKAAVHDESYRRSSLRWLPRFDSRFLHLTGTMEMLFHEGNKNAFGFDLSLFHEIQFTEYHATNSGHYHWHQDTHWGGSKLMQRKLSMVVQLSDPADYDGGDFEMHAEDCREVPDPKAIRAKGTVIMIPAFLRHRVTNVTRGTRYSLVSWYEGPCFR